MIKPNGTSAYSIASGTTKRKAKNVSLKELRNTLKAHGVDLDSSDRFILRQSRTIELAGTTVSGTNLIPYNREERVGSFEIS